MDNKDKQPVSMTVHVMHIKIDGSIRLILLLSDSNPYEKWLQFLPPFSANVYPETDSLIISQLRALSM